MMDELVFDTSILVDHLRGVRNATALIEKVKEGLIVGHISILTEAELFAGRDSEDLNRRALLVELLSLFNKTDMNEVIARITGEFKRKYGISLADAIIAATAFILRSKLITQNMKDFTKIKEISVEKPY
ncbi:PIN domain protein [mine drainage metagenome]|uniref:PIN domain protein n=1 Tax=mine drainage metagenome TaxID=410659 RepID=T1B5Y6_9ZZZZ